MSICLKHNSRFMALKRRSCNRRRGKVEKNVSAALIRTSEFFSPQPKHWVLRIARWTDRLSGTENVSGMKRQQFPIFTQSVLLNVSRSSMGTESTQTHIQKTSTLSAPLGQNKLKDQNCLLYIKCCIIIFSSIKLISHRFEIIGFSFHFSKLVYSSYFTVLSMKISTKF